ncbi:hypothetical protein [Cohnella sp. GCM10027633]|uniref:hypothetical protein n=1 Tax=unclassified Cohnella TaxID=2636738 RepID=UPI0036299706
MRVQIGVWLFLFVALIVAAAVEFRMQRKFEAESSKSSPPPFKPREQADSPVPGEEEPKP